MEPRWTTWREAPAVIGHPAYLRRTFGIAGVVGTILFVINQLDVVLEGRATARTWAKVALTYLVPFCVSNYGLLVGRRERRPDPRPGATPSPSSKMNDK